MYTYNLKNSEFSPVEEQKKISFTRAFPMLCTPSPFLTPYLKIHPPDHTPENTPVISWLKASGDDIMKNHMHFKNTIFIIF